MAAINNLSFLNEVLHACRRRLLEVYIFGGWAEELWGLSEPRQHNDIDLLLRGDDLKPVENAIREEERWREIALKHFPHKRAITMRGIMVEFIMVKEDHNGFFTDYSLKYRFKWPGDTFSHAIDVMRREVRIASKSSLIEYRSKHHLIRKAYKDYIAERSKDSQGVRAPCPPAGGQQAGPNATLRHESR